MMADKKANKEEKKSHQPFDGNEFEMLLERVALNLQQKGLWKYCEREVDKPVEAKADEHTTWVEEPWRTKEYLYDGMTDGYEI
ncbi:hypothetical protein PC129_g22966 [Phytophthora cactorum]|uniref:Uncharacterized protein n=1 Tax=Phytophthora cactorum TaxID=29920 RepID=A0A329SWP5_9STRA|nr:hypothetical protein PC118_g14903 [Phytophthora cactorum]KAG3103243.1 hypothetical protein PC122_g1891 [Phytophthora cactorum]KAG3166619.1 hypothetical protein C6341_g11998 [Phytophthora cactorum]KAG3203231.1 hypothetical protein PC129_g22966 [Phytophthora cactorum]KAG4237683.1 hypothetical protein PC116_g14264 [Phytophthora cactorum]